MVVLKAAVTQSDRRRTDEDAVIKSSAQQPSNRDPNKFRLFALPAELRLRIYKFVFSPCPVIKLRKRRLSDRSKKQKQQQREDANLQITAPVVGVPRDSNVLNCDRLIGSYTHVEGIKTKWTTSICGIIFANKLTYREATPVLYEC